ncbi:Transcriptional activator of fatty acid utilization [Microsporum ferrugineum]
MSSATPDPETSKTMAGAGEQQHEAAPSLVGKARSVASGTSPRGDGGEDSGPVGGKQTVQPANSGSQMSFRRQRASRACETCHARKVRCDAASLGVPCTNCVAFSIECKIPSPRRKKNQAKSKDGSEEAQGNEDDPRDEKADRKVKPSDGMPSTSLTDAQQAHQATQNTSYAQFMKPKFARAPITEAGRVAYLGESSNLTLLVQDRHGTTDVVHYPLPEGMRGSRSRLTELDSLEIDILNQRGAFLLPPRALCDELVDAYFKWVAPVVPLINRSRFMRQYRDPKNPPSLLLLQAILLAGSRVCTNPQLMDANGSTTPAAMTFYKRAKALYDANYEDDRVTIVQALLLMGWYWEGPEDVTKNVFFWTRVAIIIAQGSGMHRSVETSQLSRPDKRLWKRVWWTLFTRDRSVAVALGRPVNINTDDSDVEMLTEDDFIEDDADGPADYPPDPTHVQFFLQYVKLCEIMDLVLSQQYSVASKSRRTNAIDLTHSDMALADWLQNCPKEVYWERSRHHFWSALLHSNYYTTLCLLHRAHMPPATAGQSAGSDGISYPSRTIAFQAAAMITSITESLQKHQQIRFAPAFILFSALIMHVYQMRSSVPSIVATSQERINRCMSALKDVSKVWLVARMVHTLFESILGNKALEERLQKAAGKRHQKARRQQQQQQQQPPEAQKRPDPPKRKFDDMDISMPNGPPAAQVSYERSRPQTPAATPSMTPSQLPGNLGGPTAGSAQQHQQQQNQRMPTDAFLGTGNGIGTGTGNTRPTSPFNPALSIPQSPPDLFLVTRNSPSISQSLWENFQPDQLFPDGTNMSFSGFSPASTNVDPQLQMPSLNNTGMPMGMPGQTHLQQHLSPRTARGAHESPTLLGGLDRMSPQHQMGQGVPMQGQWPMQTFDPNVPMDVSSQDDNWSNSSRQGAIPPTLNVEDWFQFFGINGLPDLSVENL